jgi:hypothetical protein
VSIRLFLPRFTDVGYVSRVVVEVDAVVSPAGGVAVVVAHGQVASPILKVKRSHSTNFCGCLLSLCKTRYMLCLECACMVGHVCFIILAFHTSTFRGALQCEGLFPAQFKQNPISDTSLGL